MANRTAAKQSDHDRVVVASASCYAKWVQEGGKVSTNPNGEQNFWVGSEENPRYPDVVLWRPRSPGASGGSVSRIEEIETDDSVTRQEATQWKDYGSLGITFYLVVPRAKAANAAQLVREVKAAVSKIQAWYVEGGQVRFQDYA